MKKLFLYSVILLFFTTCSKNNIANNNCNFLLNLGVNEIVNMSLPQFGQLIFPNNPVYIQNGGNGGIIVNYTGINYVAFDAYDPNHVPSSCSLLTINGIEATCGCLDANTYSLVTGQPLNDSSLRCGLKAYRVEVSGNNLIITN